MGHLSNASHGSYTTHIHELRRWFFDSPWGEFVRHKPTGKALARELGVPTPVDIPVPPAVVIKPTRSHSAKGVVRITDTREWVFEELLHDESGDEYLRDFHCYVFNGQVRMVQVSYAIQVKAHGYYLIPGWEPLHIDRRCDWLAAELPTCWPAMRDMAVTIAARFPFPIRVDMYATTRGPVFGELCATPGLVIGERITKAGNELLGSYWDEDSDCIAAGLESVGLGRDCR